MNTHKLVILLVALAAWVRIVSWVFDSGVRHVTRHPEHYGLMRVTPTLKGDH